MTSPAHDVSPSISTDYTYDSELDIADAVPLTFQCSVSFPRGTMVTYITWDVLRWGAENLSLAASDGSRLWHGDITSPFPPSGNEGYVCNRDVPYLSVTSSYVDDDIRGLWKTPMATLWHCICWQAAMWQIVTDSRNQSSSRPDLHPDCHGCPGKHGHQLLDIFKKMRAVRDLLF